MAARPPRAAARQAFRPLPDRRSSASTWCSPKRDNSRGCGVLEKLGAERVEGQCRSSRRRSRQIRPQLDYDQLFAESMKDRAVVLGYYFPASEERSRARIPAPVLKPTRLRRRHRRRHDAAIDGYTGQPAGIPEEAASRRTLQPVASTTTASRAACRCSREYKDGLLRAAVARDGARSIWARRRSSP